MSIGCNIDLYNYQWRLLELRVAAIVVNCNILNLLFHWLWSHHYESAIAIIEEFLSECLNIIGGYAFEDAEILVFVVVTLVVIAKDC